LLSTLLRRGTSNGQPMVQLPQPMQLPLMKSTMPLVYLTMAPGAGQLRRQPGSSQCMQPSLRISHSSLLSSVSTSEKRITVQL
jgi:hypothetical protein